jgi:plasmid replication initiation protein
MKREEITLLREYQVVKHNNLIQKSRYELSTQEQKMILYLITKIKTDDNAIDLYEFKIKDFCAVCGIDETSGKNYADLKRTVEVLTKKVIWVTLDNGYETIVRWIERPYINRKSGIIKIKLDELMRPYLLQLKEKFTSYSLYYTLAMKSKYSIRVYEILKSYENLSEYTFEIDALKKMLSAEKYEMYKDFRVKVLDIAVKEINDFSDISVTYTVIKKGKKADKIKFKIKAKKDIKERVETFKKIEQNINPRKIKISEQPNIFISYDDNEPIIDTIINNTDI